MKEFLSELKILKYIWKETLSADNPWRGKWSGALQMKTKAKKPESFRKF